MNSSTLFYKDIAIILGTLYETIPTPNRFDEIPVKKLLDANLGEGVSESEERVVKFYDTIDWLIAEDYLRIKTIYPFISRPHGNITFFPQDTWITEKGIAFLNQPVEENIKIADECIDYLRAIRDKVVSKAIDAGIDQVITTGIRLYNAINS